MRQRPSLVATPLSRYRPAADVADVIGRPYRTIQTWAREQRIPSTRDRNGRLLVDLVAAARLSATAGRRRRRPAHEA